MARPKNLKFKMRGKNWTISFVPDIEVVGKEFEGVGKDTSGFVDVNGDRIFIADDLTREAEESTILHEILHVAAPRLSENTIAMLERHLYPVLRKYGLKFIK